MDLDDLRSDIRGDLTNILRAADAFIFREETSAYTDIATAVRKLALDSKAPASFHSGTRHRNLLTLAYHEVYVNSDLLTQEDGWVLAAPPYNLSFRSRIHVAFTGYRRVPLNTWLDEHYVQQETRSAALRRIANREGAHRVNRPEVGMGVIAVPIEATDTVRARDFELPWQEFVVEAGLALAFASRFVEGSMQPIIDLDRFHRTYPHWKPYLGLSDQRDVERHPPLEPPS